MEHRWFYVRGTEEFRDCLNALSRGHAAEVAKIVESLASTWEQGNDLSAELIANDVYCVRSGGKDVEYRLFLIKVHFGLNEFGQVVVYVPIAVVKRPDEAIYQSYRSRAKNRELELTETEKREIIHACEAHFRTLERNLPTVSDETREFLLAIQGFHEQSAHLRRDNITIYESYSFCEWTRSLDQTQLRVLHTRLIELVERIGSEKNSRFGGDLDKVIVDLPEIGWREEIWYSVKQNETGTILFLCRTDEYDDEEIHRLSFRAYPSYVIYGEDLWLAIQRQQAVSLALSPEEEEIIEDVLKKQELPVFISGRAGSGKSTMLYYLFSNYWYYLDQFRSKMVFLTYTTNLKQAASVQINRVTELLAHVDSVDKRRGDYPPVMTTCEFLLLLLGNPEGSYPQHQYLDFNRFRTLVRKNRSLRISEDVCWHVIRTYIKGYFSDRLMTPEEYAQIPSKDKTVNEAEFREAYQVFSWFRENYPEYWDELDLARELLQRDDLPEYYIIFCDEAQDFTRVEFELMFRLSFASRYDFGYEMPIVPLVLAGDPLQTINPTGFRPEALRALLYDMVVQRVKCSVAASRREHYRELVHNYRSSEDITRLSNLINLVRSSVLARRPRDYGFPQAPWRKGESSPPGLLPLSRFNTDPAPDSFHIIIHPELKEQIHSDPDSASEHVAIRELIAKEEPNLWTPLEIKGLEKDYVVIYGFGQILRQLLEKICVQSQGSLSLENPETRRRISELVTESTDARIKLEYFFSNLYVAITRGVNHLYIVDTQTGCETLWNLLLDEGRWLPLLEVARSPEWAVREYFSGVVPVDQISSKPIDMHEEARQSRKRWKEERDVDSARRAVRWYRKLKNVREADIIQAEIYEYEREWGKASEYYENAGDTEKAVLCRFRNSEWQEVCRLLNANTSLRSNPLNDWIKAWVQVKQHIEESLTNQTSQEQKQWISERLGNWLSQTEDVLSAYTQGIDRETIKSEVRRTLDQVEGKISKEARSYLRQTLISQYEKLLSFVSPDMKAGIVQRLKNEYWADRKYSDFISICDSYGLDEQDQGRYLTAKAEMRGFPVGLSYLIQEQAFSEAVDFWKKHGSPWVTETVELIGPLLGRREATTALEVAIRNFRLDLVAYVLDKALSDRDVRREELVALLQRMLSVAEAQPETPLILAVTIACLKLGSRDESFRAMHLCIQTGVEAKQVVGLVIEHDCDDFLIGRILASEMLARSGVEYLLKDMKFVSYILNGLSEYLSHARIYAKTIEDFLYKFSGRVYKIARRRNFSEPRELVIEIDYLHDIIKFRVANLIADPRRAAIIRDLLQAKDILNEMLAEVASEHEQTETTLSLAGDDWNYILRCVKGDQIQLGQDERAHYFHLPDTPIIVRLLRQERRMLFVNTETGDTKSYFRSTSRSKVESLWGHGEVRVEKTRATITTDATSLEIEIDPARGSQ